MRTLGKHGLIVSTLAIMAIACGPDRPANQPSPLPPSSPLASIEANPLAPKTAIPENPAAPPPIDAKLQTNALEGTPAPADAPVRSGKSLSDEDVISVVAIANNGEVELADLAIKKASSTEVKQYAAMMKTHHSAAAAKGKTVASKAKLTPTENEVSFQLQQDVESTVKSLKGKQGTAFDRAYIDAQVRNHQEVLSTIDNKLLPNATNGEVKTMLTDMRRTVTNHLSKAGEISKKSK